MRYTLRQLEVFVAIARLENVSAAARQLAMSQSATSTALAELERQFDLKLFDRVGKSLRLNELGRDLLPRAIEILPSLRSEADAIYARLLSGISKAEFAAVKTLLATMSRNLED